MRACIHGGAAEIGGSCVELEASGHRLVLDLGRPLWSELGEDVPLPQIPGLLDTNDSTLEGVLISHGHPDHYGLVNQINPGVPIYIGEAAARILNEAAFFTGQRGGIRPGGHLQDRVPIALGPFRVTPLLVDHSAFDSHALLIEAEGRRLLYTGDLRAHGRKPGTFERLLRQPPKGINALLLEGTRLSRPDSGGPESERDVERACVDAFGAAEGMVLAAYSPQNVDRYVSIYRAAVSSGRQLVIDLYTAAVAAATGRETIPQAGWEHVKVFVPRGQRIRVKESGAFERVNAIRSKRVFPEQLADLRDRLVMTFRASMAAELERAGCLGGSAAVWSMWPGYLREPSADLFKAFLNRNGIPLSVIHASGHASVADLRRLVDALGADRIVPIHTERPESYESIFGAAELHADGEWWPV
jgi:ribonuclease J